MKKFILPFLILSYPALAATVSPAPAAKAMPVEAVEKIAVGKPGQSASAQPVTISAAKSLEWNRKARTYTARGDVVVTQGEIKIQSDTLVARYDDDSGVTNIKTLEAEGNVRVTSAPYTAYGEKAVYTVKTGNAVLTGDGLKIVSDKNTLTAKEKIEYTAKDNKMTALGGATAHSGDNTLTADTMSAFFTKDAQGKMIAHKIAANGHVTIKTLKETATGDEGVYDVPTQKAVLSGKVRLLQGENWLEGTRADVDMVSGISQLSGSDNAATGGRVTGTFYPKNDTPPEGAKEDKKSESGKQ